jgi:hypothetical protein
MLVRREVGAGDEVGKTNKTTLLLTMSYEDLRDRLGAATTLGGLDAGTHLAPETVRRLCCDGSVIPIVLGADGEVMDWGLEKRFFTDAHARAKNGAPAQSTTGVASANSTHTTSFAGSVCASDVVMCTIASASTGTVKMRLTQKRRVMSRSSGFSTSAAVTVRGSRAMPHFGHVPGRSLTTSGCIGQ